MPRIITINFYRNWSKIVIFAKKKKNYKDIEHWWLRPLAPVTPPPPDADFWLRACF